MCVTSLCTRGALDMWSRGRSTTALCALETAALKLAGFAMAADLNGRKILIGAGPKRTLFWYAKFAFACYAAGLASFLVVFASVLFASTFSVSAAEFAGRWFFPADDRIGPLGWLIVALGAAWSPLMWRRLR